MDSQLKDDPSSSGKTTSKVINSIHSMPWLKQDLCPQSGNAQQCVAKDGQILSSKKTDEDYFPGTRDEKKGKKKKEKKVKSMVAIGNLGDLVNLTQQNKQKVMTQAHDNDEISEYYPSAVQEETNINSKVYQTLANSTVWSTTTSTAEKLFPNVQSSIIDRMEEEEMLSRAIAESIATIQLEQFKKPSPVKENQWKALYGEDDDEGGWDNVRRNLPPSPEPTESIGDPSDQRKSCDDNSNSSKTGGILKNRHDNPERYFIKPDELDFGFKTCLESSKDEVKTSESLKSVSFNESITVKVRSSESSENEECEKAPNPIKKEPVIDKYGRVDGYSERRLFMGKGARLKELEFLQSKFCLGVGEPQCQKFESNAKAPAVIETEKPAVRPSKTLESEKPVQETETEREIIVENLHEPPETRYQELKSDSQAKETTEAEKPAITISECLETVQSQKTISNLEQPKTEKAANSKNAHRSSGTRNQKYKSNSQTTGITDTQKPVKATSQRAENLHSQKSVSNIKNHRSKKSVAAKNVHRAVEPPRNAKQTKDEAEKLTESAVKLPVETPSPDSHCVRENATTYRAEEPSNEHVSSVESKLAMAEKKEEEMKSRAQITKEIENVVTPDEVVSNTSGGIQVEEKETHYSKDHLVSPNTKTVTSENEKSAGEMVIDSLQGKETKEKKYIKDLEENNVTDATMSKDLAEMFKMIDNLSKDEAPESKSSYCLVPTLVRQDKYTLNFSPINIQDIDSNEVTVNAESQSPACQNLLLAGVSCWDSIDDAQSLIMYDSESQNSQYQNDSIGDFSIPLNTVSMQYQNLNNMQQIQPTCIRNEETQIYQNTLINQLPNLNNNPYSMPSNYTNVGNKLQMDQRDYANLIHILGLQNLPYQHNVSNFVDNEENVWPDQGIQDSRWIADYKKWISNESASNEERSFSGRAPPGLVRNVKLPPGFTKKVHVQGDNVEENDRTMDLPAVNESVINDKSKQRKYGDKRSELRSRNTCREETQGNSGRGRPGRHGRTSRSPVKKRQYYSRSQNDFKPQESNHTENRRGPYAILGATQNPREKCNSLKNDNLKISQSPKVQREDITEINQPPSTSKSVLPTGNDNTGENLMGQNSSNNNYPASSTMSTNSDLDRRGTNNPNVAIPVMYQISANQSLCSNGMANWQYNMNLIDQTNMPINLVPDYQMLVTNAHNSQLNPLADCFEASGYQNQDYQQLPIQMLNRAQVPGYGVPRVLDEEGNNTQNLRPGNMESFEMYRMLNHDHPVGMQRSISGTLSCPDYNLNDSLLGQFMSNLNFYANETLPNVQALQDVRYNQSHNTTDLIFDNLKAGRGRGRFLKKNSS